MVEPFLEGLSLQEAMDGNRIFMVNLEILSRLDHDQIPSPFALFFLNGKKNLMPIAIQLFQQKGDDNPVFLPSDPWYTWSLVKMWYNNAEAQYHRACSLIGYTHLFIEAVAVATHRNLSPSHPVFRLLAPFIRDVIPLNCFELNELLAPGSWVDKVTTLGSQGTLNLLSLGWQEWRLDVQGCLPKDLSTRGVDNPEVLPDYPYRDDSLPLYHSIENLVRTIVYNRYLDPDILRNDSELSAWSRELASDGSDGCSIKGIPGDGLISTPDELVLVLTSIIFVSTVGHSAVNTPQYEEYGYLPNYPAVLRGSPPRDKSWREESAILACLPSKSVSLDIMLITKLLSEKHSYGLSNLGAQYMYHPDDVKAWERFIDDLRGIAHTIQDNNRKRSTVYDYINPIKTL
ncbi:arachidonate 8S-lipoxygenase-like isoform X2 [Actinia tenebrosa]|nr:arachidonate 8S-lipoxygenase-like isoform X2 [Actinia tenebrosa]